MVNQKQISFTENKFKKCKECEKLCLVIYSFKSYKSRNLENIDLKNVKYFVINKCKSRYIWGEICNEHDDKRFELTLIYEELLTNILIDIK